MRPALPLVFLALLLAGCGAPPPSGASPLLVFSGRGCTEVGVLVPVDIERVRELEPLGLNASSDGRGNGVVAVAFNHCTFRIADGPEQAAWEAFVWLAVGPSRGLELVRGGPHAFEAHHWREAGAALDGARGALPNLTAATFTGPAAFAPGAAFDLTARPASGGMLRMNGTAAAPTTTVDHPETACCRTFVWGSGALLRVDYTSTDQPQGTAQCTVQTDLPALTRLLGGPEAQGTCAHNAGYDFTAEVRPV